MTRYRRGFTLVELLIVIAIIGLLASIMLPAALRARENARRIKCVNNLHQLMVAVQAYESKYRVFPPGRVGCDCSKWGPCKDVKGYQRPGTSGFALMLPELDELGTYRLLNNFQKGGIAPGDWAAIAEPQQPNSGVTFRDPTCDDNTTTNWFNISAQGGTNVRSALNTRPQVFVCPSDRGGVNYGGMKGIWYGTNSYAFCLGNSLTNANSTNANAWLGTANDKSLAPDPGDRIAYQNNGAFGYRFPKGSQDVTDGLANTIFMGDCSMPSDFVGYGKASDHWGTNRWAVAWRFADSLRSTCNGINGKVRSWTVKGDSGYVRGLFGSCHISGANFAFGDGHVQFLNDMLLDQNIFDALGSINNGTSTYEVGLTAPPP